MMRVSSFGRSLGFSALAAVGWLPWLIVSAPLLGGWNAQAIYLIVVSVAYLAAIGERLRIGVVSAAAFVAMAIALSVDTTAQLTIALAALLGAFRSGILYRPATARSVALELGLLGGGLLFARFLAWPGPLGPAIGLWGFFLFQSLYFLRGDLAGLSRRRGPAVDGFETACRHATELLDRT